MHALLFVVPTSYYYVATVQYVYPKEIRRPLFENHKYESKSRSKKGEPKS